MTQRRGGFRNVHWLHTCTGEIFCRAGLCDNDNCKFMALRYTKRSPFMLRRRLDVNL